MTTHDQPTTLQKIQETSEANSVPVVSLEPPKRKRGRPRKNCLAPTKEIPATPPAVAASDYTLLKAAC